MSSAGGSSAVGEGRHRVEGDDVCQLSGRDHLPYSLQRQPHVGRHSLSAYSRYPNDLGGKRRYVCHSRAPVVRTVVEVGPRADTKGRQNR